MVMNSDKVSLKSFDMKKINIENIVINMMADLFFPVQFTIYIS